MIEQLARLAYSEMFENTPAEGIEFNHSYTMSGLARITLFHTHQGKRIRFMFLEQNPYKNSIYGNRAKEGAKIMWTIVKRGSIERWLGRMDNGVWYAK